MKDKNISPMKHIGYALSALENALLEKNKEKRKVEIAKWQDNFKKVYEIPEDALAAEKWSMETEENWTAYRMFWLSVAAKKIS